MTAGAAEQGWRRVTGRCTRPAGGSPRSSGTSAAPARRSTASPAWTPSGTPGGTHAMTPADIDVLLAAYADAARVAVRAGFDAVEIHAAHGYLLDEFLWPHTNRRTDRFGGTPAARAVFPAEVIRAVRSAVPASMPVIVRFSQFKERDYTARIAESPAELAVILERLRRRRRRRAARLPAPLHRPGVPRLPAQPGRLGPAPHRPAVHHRRLDRTDPRLPRLRHAPHPDRPPRRGRIRPRRPRAHPARQPGLGDPGRGRPARRDHRLPQVR